MSHRSRYTLYYGFLALIVVAIFVAPSFSAALERMSLVPYAALCGAISFVLVTFYQGVAAKFGILPFRPKDWVLRLFRGHD